MDKKKTKPKKQEKMDEGDMQEAATLESARSAKKAYKSGGMVRRGYGKARCPKK